MRSESQSWNAGVEDMSKGMTIEQCMEASRQLFKKSAKHGYASSPVALGDCLANAMCVSKDKAAK